jgi:hypothetical protein
MIPPINNHTNNPHQQQVIDMHTANLKFMNNTLPAHYQADGQAKIKIADLNNALDNIMTLQGKAQSPKQGLSSKDIGHFSPYNK